MQFVQIQVDCGKFYITVNAPTTLASEKYIHNLRKATRFVFIVAANREKQSCMFVLYPVRNLSMTFLFEDN